MFYSVQLGSRWHSKPLKIWRKRVLSCYLKKILIVIYNLKTSSKKYTYSIKTHYFFHFIEKERLKKKKKIFFKRVLSNFSFLFFLLIIGKCFFLLLSGFPVLSCDDPWLWLACTLFERSRTSLAERLMDKITNITSFFSKLTPNSNLQN